MRMIPESARTVIEAGKLAHLATIGEDGAPQVTCAWVGLDNDEIVIGTLMDQRKLENIRRNPQVSISIETGGVNPYGLNEYLVVNGRAVVTEGGAPELLQRLARVYIGPDVKFPPMDDPPTGFVTRITPERFGGVGPWA
jgi:PPOX class probable F420-dependent enzyme